MSTPVLLRNGTLAEIVRGNPITCPAGFPLTGRTRNGQLELWKSCGHWREDGTEHPLDIVRGLHVPLTAADLEKRKGSAA